MAAEDFAFLPDPLLIEACLNGKGQAWEALILRYQRLIYSIPLRYGVSESDASDIFQNVCLLLLENLARLRNRERLGAWLAITTRREAWRVMRQSRQAVSALENSDDDEGVFAEEPPSEEDFIRLEQQSIVHAAVAQMGQPCNQLLTLLFYQEPRPAYSEIASALSIPEGSIGPNRARCLEKLLKILEKQNFLEL